MTEPQHIFPPDDAAAIRERSRVAGQRACVVWLTGLSGSGKSTIARAVESELLARRHLAFVLDGDGLRTGLNADLGFSPAARAENIRRAAYVAGLLADAGVIVLTAFISPYRAGRDTARQVVGAARFIEVYLDVPLDVCEKRDPKGLYGKARSAVVSDFTGVTAPYEPPSSPDLRLDSSRLDVRECVETILGRLESGGYLRAVP